MPHPGPLLHPGQAAHWDRASIVRCPVVAFLCRAVAGHWDEADPDPGSDRAFAGAGAEEAFGPLLAVCLSARHRPLQRTFHRTDGQSGHLGYRPVSWAMEMGPARLY